MTKRKDPSELSERALKARSLTPVKPKKHGADGTEEGKAKRIAALRAKSKPMQTLEAISQANPDRPLTEKQKLFAKFWAQGETIRSASLKAGYNDGASIAYRMSADPAILKIYNREKALYEEASQMSRKKVMDMLMEAYDAAKMVSEPASMVSAAREIGKMCGYYEPVKRQIDINVSGDVTVKKLERMSDADLIKIMKGEVEDVVFQELEDDSEEG